MATEAQINANRANARHSTGARTLEGKARSCQNNLRWGFAGSFRVLPSEDQEEFDALYRSLRDEHKPETPTEEILVEKMAQHLWLSRRAQDLQDGIIVNQADFAPADISRYFSLFLRYQTTNDRAFHKALAELVRLRAEKRKAEIGFERKKHRQELIELRRAAEKRKQDRHAAEVALALAKADHQAMTNMMLGQANPHLHPLSSAAAGRIIAASGTKAA